MQSIPIDYLDWQWSQWPRDPATTPFKTEAKKLGMSVSSYNNIFSVNLWRPIGSVEITPTSRGPSVTPIVPSVTPVAPPMVLPQDKVILTIKDRQNVFTIQAGNIRRVFHILDAYSAVDKTTYSGRKRSTKKIHFIRQSYRGGQYVTEADVGMMYYFADHLVDPEKGFGFTVDIIDERKKINNNFVEIEGKINPKTGEAFDFRDYQRKAVEAALKRKNGILRLATGAGKTEIAIGLIGKLGEDAIFVVPRKTLAIQTRDRFLERGFKSVGVLYGANTKEEKEEVGIKNTPELDVNVCVINTIQDLLGVTKSRKSTNPDVIREREAKVKEFYNFLKEVNVLVFDEAHHVKAQSGKAGGMPYYASVAQAIPASYRYGLSATPFADTPLETAQVRDKLGDILYDLPASKLIEYDDGKQYLSQPVIKFIANYVPESLITLFNKLYAEAYARAEERAQARGAEFTRPPNRYPSFIDAFIILNEARNRLIAEICKEGYKRSMPTLVIVERIDHGVRLKMLLDEMRISSEMVASAPDEGEEGEEPEEEEQNEAVERIHIMRTKLEREEVFDKLKTKKIAVMIGTSGLVGEGLDLPALMLCIIAQGGKAFIRTYQRIGRAMRLHLDETTPFRQTHSIIVDFLDGMGTNRDDITQIIPEAIPPEYMFSFIPLKHLGEHFFRRKNLYESEKHFIMSWAKNLKDIFKVKKKDGSIVDPWV